MTVVYLDLRCHRPNNDRRPEYTLLRVLYPSRNHFMMHLPEILPENHVYSLWNCIIYQEIHRYYRIDPGWTVDYPLDNFGTVVGENLDCLLLSGTVVGENPDHVCWVYNMLSIMTSDVQVFLFFSKIPGDIHSVPVFMKTCSVKSPILCATSKFNETLLVEFNFFFF